MSNLPTLDVLKKQIEQMGKKHHIEILKILKRNSQIKLNENKSGVYINLSFLPQNTIDEIAEYMHYIQDQEFLLMPFESQKEDFKNTFFVEKEDKEEPTLSYICASK